MSINTDRSEVLDGLVMVVVHTMKTVVVVDNIDIVEVLITQVGVAWLVEIV
jgi:hypothetical protein